MSGEEGAPATWPEEPLTPESFGQMLEAICPSSLAAHLDPSRPYDGQPHTVYGERGAAEVHGVTFRDVQDAFIRACYESSGLPVEQWPGSVHDLPWDDMDILAVSQNLGCNIEKAMGIYPNVPRLLPVDPTELHWCGWPLEQAEWTRHAGDCPSQADR